jgi:hypothetical protein
MRKGRIDEKRKERASSTLGYIVNFTRGRSE